MGDFNWWRWGAYAGLAFVGLQFLTPIPPILAGVPPDPADASALAAYLAGHRVNILAADWLGSLGSVMFVPFLASLRHSIRSKGADWEWPAGVVFAAGIAWAAVRLAHSGLQMASVLDTTVTGEPVAVRALTEASFGVGFTVVWLFAALSIAIASYAVHRGQILPGWTAWIGYVVAALTFITSLAIFSGAKGSSVGGLNLLLGLLPLTIWVAAVSVAMLGRQQPGVGRPAVSS
jgi:hypothetical protein